MDPGSSSGRAAEDTADTEPDGTPRVIVESAVEGPPSAPLRRASVRLPAWPSVATAPPLPPPPPPPPPPPSDPPPAVTSDVAPSASSENREKRDGFIDIGSPIAAASSEHVTASYRAIVKAVAIASGSFALFVGMRAGPTSSTHASSLCDPETDIATVPSISVPFSSPIAPPSASAAPSAPPSGSARAKAPAGRAAR